MTFMNNVRLNILLLEDDAVFAKALSNNLIKRGHNVSHAADIISLDEILSSQRPADLILLDLKLEQETSISHISKIRAAYPNSKIYMITAYASITTTVDAIKLGADDYLPKPLTASDILNCYFGKGIKDNEEILSPRRLEWEHIQRVLKESNGNISETARKLNMHRRTLQRKLQKKPQQP